MADAAVDMEATDLASLGGNFHAQSSSAEQYSTESLALSNIGDAACTNEYDKGTNYSVTYKYCGTDLATDLGTFVTTFGKVENSILWTGMSIRFAAGQQPEITLTGHNHDDNPHDGTTNPAKTFDITGAIPASTGLNVPEFWVSAGETGSTASRVEATLTIGVNHVDKIANAGTHFVGDSLTCRADCEVGYEGDAGAITAGSWLQIRKTTGDANDDTDTSSVTGHQYFDAN